MDWIIRLCNETLLNQEFDSTGLTEITAKELDEIFAAASMHGVLPVVMKSLENKADFSSDKITVIIEWYAVSENSKNEYSKRMSLMKELALQFNHAGLDVMFLKGATIAKLYPSPDLRVFGDIDYYMYGESDKSIAILKEMNVDTKEYFNHHTQAGIDGVLLENHYDFLDRDNHKGNLLLDNELKRLAKTEGHQYPFTFDDKSITNAYCMSPTMNAIFLMRHMAAHFFSESISLRMLYDWALFQKQCAKDVDWTLTLELYKEAGMPIFPQMIQGIIKTKLGWELSDSPIKPINDEMTEHIWRSIVKPPMANPYKRNSLRYLLYEAKVFYNNRWKHELVFKDESYWYLFFSYTYQYMKKLI